MDQGSIDKAIMDTNDLIELVQERSGELGSFAVLSRTAAIPEVVALPGGQWLDDVRQATDLDEAGPLGLVVVTNQLEHMEKAAARHLLARLRDGHAAMLVAHDPSRVFSTADYLALGFEVDARADCYVYDANAASRQRDWNNASNWANPENFDKFRW